MCIKAGNNELGLVKALMAMSLNALIAEVFDRDLDELDNYLSLTRDLGMDKTREEELNILMILALIFPRLILWNSCFRP